MGGPCLLLGQDRWNAKVAKVAKEDRNAETQSGGRKPESGL